FARQFLPERPLPLRHPPRHLDAQNDIQLAAPAAAERQTVSADTHFLDVLRARRNFDADLAAERRHGDFCAEHRFPRGEVKIVVQVVAFRAIVRMFREANAQKQIAGRTAPDPSLPTTGQSEALTFPNAGGDFDLVVFNFAYSSTPLTLRADAIPYLAVAAATFAGRVAPQ